jgi:hypothetical protein
MKFSKVATIIAVVSFIGILAAVLFIWQKESTDHDDERHSNLSSQAHKLGVTEAQSPRRPKNEGTPSIWNLEYVADKSQVPDPQARLNRLDRHGRAVVLKRSAVHLQNGDEHLILDIKGANRIRSLHVNPPGTLFSVVAEFEELDKILVFQSEGGNKLVEFPHVDFLDVFRRDYLSCFWLDEHHVGKVSQVPRLEFLRLRNRYDIQVSSPIPGANESSAENFLTFGITDIVTLEFSLVAIPLPTDRVIQFNYEMQESGWISFSERIGSELKEFWLVLSPRH